MELNQAEMNKMLNRVVVGVDASEEKIALRFEGGARGEFFHVQDCCEAVWVEDVNGNWNDLVGHPLLVAEERVDCSPPGNFESETWTFYTFRSVAGSVDVRWIGESNGYYSEDVDFIFYEAGQ